MAGASVAHTFVDDAQALTAGTLFVALGVLMFAKAGLLSGGAVGLAFLLHYATGIGFAPLFLAINLPLLLFAWRRMGRRFMLKTLVSILLMASFSELSPRLLTISAINPIYAAFMGGLLVGTGLLILFRHQASLGGINVVVLYLQERCGWPAGKLQLLIDGAIIATALTVVPWTLVATSLLGALSLNVILAINHKPGRYMAA